MTAGDSTTAAAAATPSSRFTARGRWGCLMYHSVPASANGADYFAVPRSEFAAQLDILRALGCRGASLEEVLRSPTSSDGATPVAITFDDGYADNFSEALPELAARGMSATVFVVTSRVGTSGYMTWDELRAMKNAGISIQSHTHTHPFLSTLPPDDARAELETARQLLDRELGQSTTTVALPNGDAPRGWGRADFASAGMEWVATSSFGPNDGRGWRVRRYTVRRGTTRAEFARMVRDLPSSWSREGVRLRTLGVVRSLLGVSRYARWRRRVLRALGR